MIACLPHRLRVCRRILGLSQAEVAEQLGWQQGRVSSYESGRVTPDLETLVALARVLVTSVDYLIGRTDDPLPPHRA